jgi:hypothetical protein
MMNAIRKRIKIFGLHQQEGAALIIAVMILLILTVLGIYAITTSTLETKIAGSEKVLKDAFYAADGGVDCGRIMIALFLTQQSPTLPYYGISVDNATNFRNEIIGTAVISPPPHVDKHIGGSDTQIAVDRIRAEEPPGYSGEFGAAVGEKKTSIYYRVDSSSIGIANASSEIDATYRYVIQ